MLFKQLYLKKLHIELSMPKHEHRNTSLIVVNLQNDFIPEHKIIIDKLKQKPFTIKIDRIVYNGTDSPFFDNGHQRDTGLTDYLRENDVTDVFFAGFATEYCVKYSVLDAISLGFNTYIIYDACRGVNLNPDDSDKAVETMLKAGARLVRSHEVLTKKRHNKTDTIPFGCC